MRRPLVERVADADADTNLHARSATRPVDADVERRVRWRRRVSGPIESRWAYDIGGGGWGNQELETYTEPPGERERSRGARSSSPRAPSTSRGRTAIPRDYTSARLKTQGRFAQTYGRFEARIKIPRGQGIWPAFWMLGANIGAVGWPDCGEIDIMENIGREPNTVHGTFHGPGYSGGERHRRGVPESRTAGRSPTAIHLYAVEWEPAEIRWYVDGHLYQTRKPSDLPAGARWVFDHDVVHHPQRRGGRRVAGQSGSDDRVPAADAGGLRASASDQDGPSGPYRVWSGAMSRARLRRPLLGHGPRGVEDNLEHARPPPGSLDTVIARRAPRRWP